MDKLSALSRGTQIMLGAGVLLLIDTFLPWQEYDGPGSDIAEALGVEFSRNAWHGFWGWVMILALIVLLAWLVARIAGVELSLPVSETMVAAALAAIVFLFALIKNLVDDYSTIWSYIGVILAAAIAFGAWLQVQAAGGMDTLKTEMDTMRSRPTSERPPSSTTTSTAPPAQPSTPEPPPQTTPPPPSSTPPAQPGTPPTSGSPPPGEPPPASSEPTR